ncbi:hypothetical protein ColTof4_13613 [Colletotrichum tofieldiae]|nr:hypothetical protein ColTof3_14566 [Colletotrichum tofieldiae]GKT81190.1 hypothetical protein ColTof4_13613 [Colletotrichum tofieldiae]
MEPWRQPLQDFVDSCTLLVTNQHQQHLDIANKYFTLERLYAALVTPIDLRSHLPVTILPDIIAGCAPDRVSVANPQSLHQLHKACNAWNITPSVCLFLLDASSRGRPFFKFLVMLAKLCPDFQKAADALRVAASLRRERPQLKRGVAHTARGLINDDISAVIKDLESASAESTDGAESAEEDGNPGLVIQRRRRHTPPSNTVRATGLLASNVASPSAEADWLFNIDVASDDGDVGDSDSVDNKEYNQDKEAIPLGDDALVSGNQTDSINDFLE